MCVFFIYCQYVLCDSGHRWPARKQVSTKSNTVNKYINKQKRETADLGCLVFLILSFCYIHTCTHKHTYIYLCTCSHQVPKMIKNLRFGRGRWGLPSNWKIQGFRAPTRVCIGNCFIPQTTGCAEDE